MKHVSEILPAIAKEHQIPLRKSALELAEARSCHSAGAHRPRH